MAPWTSRATAGVSEDPDLPVTTPEQETSVLRRLMGQAVQADRCVEPSVAGACTSAYWEDGIGLTSQLAIGLTAL